MTSTEMNIREAKQNILEKQKTLECPICYIPYNGKNNPHLLQCGHTLCILCIKKLLVFEKGVISCPMCRKYFYYNCLEKLPKNFALISQIDMIDGFKKEMKCEILKLKINELQEVYQFNSSSEWTFHQNGRFKYQQYDLEFNVYQFQAFVKLPEQYIYYGEMENEKREGFGIQSWASGALYEGQWSDNQQSGKGRHIDKKGNLYEGDFKQNCYYGKGVLKYYNGNVLDGDFVYSNINKGKMIYPNKDQYVGSFKNDKFHGDGVFNYNNGQQYKGEFKQNKFNGEGRFKFKDGGQYKGSYEDNQRHGYGEMTYSDESVYKGQWLKDQRQGKGTLYFPNESQYSGSFSNDKYEGYGVFAYKNGESYRGIWCQGQKNGEMIHTINGKTKTEEWQFDVKLQQNKCCVVF